MNLDPKTIVFINFIGTLLMSVGLLIISRSYFAQIRGTRNWAIATFIQSVFWLLLCFRDIIPDFFSIVVSNTLMLLALVIYFQVLVKLNNLKFNSYWTYLLVVSCFFVLIYFTEIQPNYEIRVIIMSVLVALVMFACSYLLLRYRIKKNLPKAFAGYMLVFCGTLMLVCVFVIVMPSSGHNNYLLAINDFNNILYVSYFITSTVITFGFVLICNDSYLDERRLAETAFTNSNEILEKSNQIARIGTWEVDLLNNKMYWSDVTKEIKEVASDYEVELQSSISFFKEGENRNLFLDVIEESKVRPSSFDLNFQIVTAKGNERCLRVISKSEFNGNECTRIYGIFQDITERKNIENKLQKSYDEIRMLSNHILSVREEERLHIAREIHDELGQQLTVLKMDVLAISKQSNYLPLPVISKIDRMIQMIDKSIQTVKKIVTELRPGILDDLGLIAALEWQAKEFQNSTGIFCRFNSNCIVENYSDKINTAVFRIFQESLTNVARHSKATKVFTQLYNHNNMLVLEVNDNGIGMCTESINSSSSFGVLGMKERATMLNGYINIQPSPTGGTRVQVQIPIQ